MHEQLRGVQEQWAEEKVWGTGAGWAGPALWQDTQDRGCTGGPYNDE